MGLTKTDIQTLLELKAAGAPLQSVLTIGRQWLICDAKELKTLLTTYGYSGEKVEWLFQQDLTFSEPFFQFLGTEKVESLDISDFEGANLIQDLNQPLAPQYRDLRYDLTLDGGSLEHVFNVPEALRTLMTLTKVGGHTYMGNPANNFCGHGFYQFSPELMFRVFAPSNGFAIQRVILSETFESCGYRNGVHRDVRDPQELGYRSTVTSGMPLHVITVARRTAEVPIFSTAPMQSDYAAAWKRHTTTKDGNAVSSERHSRKLHSLHHLALLAKRLSPRLTQHLRMFWQPLSDNTFYKDYRSSSAAE